MSLEITGTSGILGQEPAGQGQDNPAVEGTPAPEGQVTQTPAPTPEELSSKLEQATKELEEMRSLKGRMGNELGTHKQHIARLEGQIEALSRQHQAAAPAVPSMADLQSKLDSGEISLGEFLQHRDARVLAAATSMAAKQVQQQVNQLKTYADRKEFADQFMKDNPGYEVAFNAGKLHPYMEQGYDASVAFKFYERDVAMAESVELKKKLEELNNKAKQDGVKQGVKIAEAKRAAASVLGAEPGTGSFRRAPSGAPPSKVDRVAESNKVLAQLNSRRLIGV